MLKNKQKLADDMAEIIRKSVAHTLAVMFNTSIDACQNVSKSPSVDDFIYCSEFLQEDAHAHILFLFDRELIEKFVHGIFPPEALEDPLVYESTASEIVNIVGNSLKQYLNLHGYHFEMAIPYSPEPGQHIPAGGGPLVQMAFSCKSESEIGVDFYLRGATA